MLVFNGRTLALIDTDQPVADEALLPDYLGGKVKLLGITSKGNLKVLVLPRTPDQYQDIRFPALCGCYWRIP
jgi:hypothetical protein